MKTYLFALVCMAFLSGPALASVCEEGRGPARFCAADKNHDDALSSEEFSSAFPDIQAQAFTIIDSNADQKIDLSEWQAFMGNHDAKQMPAPPAASSKPQLIEPPQHSAPMPKERP
ncbi:MAG: hypothetical protein K6G15_00690 [Desulfovibrio sp.]|nr:hypothetical protein [Desulfovibrio sp.]